MVSVRSNNQRDGDKVVAQHLPVIFTALLDMDDENLLKPETKLGQLIKLGQATELTVRPVRPEILHIQPCGRCVVEILRTKVSNLFVSYASRQHEPPCNAENVRTKPKDQKTMQYITSQACSLNRVTSFFLGRPMYLANGASTYSIVAARRPVKMTTTRKTK